MKPTRARSDPRRGSAPRSGSPSPPRTAVKRSRGGGRARPPRRSRRPPRPRSRSRSRSRTGPRGPVDWVDDPADAGGRLGARALLGSTRRRVAPADPSTIRRSQASSTSETMSVADDFVRTRGAARPGAPARARPASAARSPARASSGSSSVTLAPAVGRTIAGPPGNRSGSRSERARRPPVATPGPTYLDGDAASVPRAIRVPSMSTTPSPSTALRDDPEVSPPIGEAAPEPQALAAAVKVAVGAAAEVSHSISSGSSAIEAA